MTQPVNIPQLGLGTYARIGDEGREAILSAIEIGYRHIDTAQTYGTESNVGAAVRQSGKPRSDFFVTTKVADTNLEGETFLHSVEKSLETLGFDYVDLLLVHWPSQGDRVPFASYMEALAEAKSRGWARNIGVSNFNIALLERTAALLGLEAIVTNQVEIHPYLQAPNLSAYARSRGLTLTAYQPLCKGSVHGDAVLNAIGVRHQVSAAAVALAFLMAQGHVVIPASSSPANLKANHASLTVRLTDDEMSAIRALDRGERRINPAKSPSWDDRA